MRTPLNIVLVGLQMIANATKHISVDVESVAALCTDSLGACSEAIRILNNLLLFDRIEEGQMVLDITNNVNLENVLQKSVRLFSIEVSFCVV